MALPKFQNPQDWLSQLWNILLGKRVNPDEDGWLLGPIGDIGGIADRFVNKMAAAEGLAIHRNIPSSGLIDGFQNFKHLQSPVNPKIENFYKRTLDYHLEVWTQWRPIFGSLGFLVYKLFSQRIQQLNLPQNSLDTALGLRSDIISLVDENEKTAVRIWYRRLKKNDEVVYSGVYSHCRIPSGEPCIKVVFPLPQGNATVVLKVNTDEHGNLELLSEGKKYGDPGFYFLVEDRKGQLWKHYLASFRERIFVYEDDEGVIRADHSMSLWNRCAYKLHYKMTEIPKESLGETMAS